MKIHYIASMYLKSYEIEMPMHSKEMVIHRAIKNLIEIIKLNNLLKIFFLLKYN